MFHGDDGTVWQSGYAADVGDEKFSSAGSVGSAGDRVLIITDDAMDPLVWQGAMAAINEKGGEPVLCMWPRLETYGDENSWLCGGEMALGLSRLCQPDADSVRSWKKHYGAMHFGIGHGADRGKIVSVLRLEGIIEKITIVIDDTVLCDNGKILV